MHEWIMSVAWTDLLLASWPVPPDEMRTFAPAPLEVDTFDGSAWVSVVPFKAKDMRFRGLPPIPGQGDFCQLNCRTYVRLGETRAVLFLSLDCPGALATLIGRHLFDLPFKEAEMQISPQPTGFRVECHRVQRGDPASAFVATYSPTGSVATPAEGTLDDFLTKRMSLFVPGPAGRLTRADIAHPPWRLQPADLSIEVNTIAAATGIKLPQIKPHAAYAARTDSLVYPPRRVAEA